MLFNFTMYSHIISILVHPCDTAANGGCSQICNKKRDSYKCACKYGFKLGHDGKSCNKGLITKLTKYFVRVYAL